MSPRRAMLGTRAVDASGAFVCGDVRFARNQRSMADRS